MNPEVMVAIGIGMAMFFLTILGHIVISVFWAGGVTADLKTVKNSLDSLVKSINIFKENCYTNSDAAARDSRADKETRDLWGSLNDLRKNPIQVPRKE